MCVLCMLDFDFIVTIAQQNLFIKVNLLHTVSENITCNGMISITTWKSKILESN